MTDKQKQIIQALDKAEELLHDAAIALAVENSGGNQFDYVNAPTLADRVDRVIKLTNRIDSITYQKTV